MSQHSRLSGKHKAATEDNSWRQQIAVAVEKNFQSHTFRSSVALKDALKAIVESHVVPHLKYRYAQENFNKRVAALMKLSVSFLCMPRLSTLLGFGLIPSQNEGYEVTKRLKICVIELLLILVEAEKSKLCGGITQKYAQFLIPYAFALHSLPLNLTIIF